MELKLTWVEYKAFAMKAIKEKYPNVTDDDTVKFMKTYGYEPDAEVYAYPVYILINLESTPSPREN